MSIEAVVLLYCVGKKQYEYPADNESLKIMNIYSIAALIEWPTIIKSPEWTFFQNIDL